LLNVVSELPEADILDSESWKSVVDGSTMTGREIRQSPFTFRPVAGHVAAANRLPGTSDQTHGFWRRHIIVMFSRIFADHEQNPNLADEILKTETPAIVAWMLNGAQRVISNGVYTVPESSAKALAKWRAQADQVRAFTDDWTERLPLDAHVTEGEPADHLYKSYRMWAAENGHRPVASNTFGERMRLIGLESKPDGRVRRHPVKLTRNYHQ
jgi:phage/plasmid-associated DNA primase